MGHAPNLVLKIVMAARISWRLYGGTVSSA